MKISVIIPTYNEHKVIGACLLSLIKQQKCNFEVIIVDDGSKEKRSEEIILRLKNEFAKNQLIYLKQKHLGPAVARNKGAGIAKGQILVFVDADMTFNKMFLYELTLPIVRSEFKGTFSVNEYVSNWENVWARCWNYNDNLVSSRRHKENYPKTQLVFRAILKREFDKVGGFSQGGYTDDYTLGVKLGYEAHVVKGAKFYHQNPSSLREVFFHAKWVSKRQYKLGLIGVIIALIRNSLPVTKVVGLWKAVKYKEPLFFVFKIVYGFAVTLGIVEYWVFGKGSK